MVSATRNCEVVKLRTSTVIGLFEGASTVKNVNKYTVCGFLPGKKKAFFKDGMISST